MTKVNKLLLVLLLAQVGIFVLAKATSTGPRMVKPVKLFNKLDTDAIKEIKIVDGEKKTIELKKISDHQWVLKSAGDYPVKKDKVSDFTSKLSGLTAGSPVTTKAAHHHALEVAETQFQRDVTVLLKDGTKQRFFLGSSPMLHKVHLRFAGKDEVYLASELSTWDIGTRASSWVDTEYLKVKQDDVIAMTLQNKHGTIELKKSDGKWSLAQAEKGQQLDQSKVDSLLSSASSISLEEPVGKTIQPSYELDNPQATLTVVTETKPTKPTHDVKDEDTASEMKDTAKAASKADHEGKTTTEHVKPEKPVRKTYRLKIGAKKKDGFFAKSETSEFVVRVASTADTFVDKKAADLLVKEDKDNTKEDFDDHKP